MLRSWEKIYEKEFIYKYNWLFEGDLLFFNRSRLVIKEFGYVKSI